MLYFKKIDRPTNRPKTNKGKENPNISKYKTQIIYDNK